MVEKQMGKLLLEAINEMNFKYKSILTGYYYNQLSVSELAEINNTSSREIYRLLCGARQVLREYLNKKGIQETEYPQSLSLATELFLTYGENAIKETERINHEK